MKPKSINSLMAYMRDEKEIKINGSIQKRQLRCMGYYHGYKGYRFCGNPGVHLDIHDFRELQALYEFDMMLKNVLYPQIMFIETTYKNYALEVLLEEGKSERFEDIYFKMMNHHKEYSVDTKYYKKAMSKKLNVRNRIYSTISSNYGKRGIVNHYYNKGQPLPIWAIFELISLGDFGNFISCLNSDVRKKISKSIGIKTAVDGDGKLIEIIVYTLKDLRNAVAHNNTVFDTRFKSGGVSRRISSYIGAETGISNISFNTIVDYVILISFLMKLLACNKTDIVKFICQFEKACEHLRGNVSMQIYSKVVYTDTRNKIAKLKEFL